MQILHRNETGRKPTVSFVLLDWSCRESLHSLDYLADQDVSRDNYEIIWIEYFSRRDRQLQIRFDTAERDRTARPVDTWIVMETPDNVCHHKHLMYNVGLAASRGELVCFCDSDAMFRRGFVRSIIEAFEADPQIVLHHDQVRNHSPRFYPFRYPAFEDVVGRGAGNWINGKPLGLWDEDDPLHSRNYGASMTAQRDDLIAIGGADMHTDYLGHICGPYEMTFRLRNHGCREVWHQDEYLYHTWHPGQAGTVDYCGPHDGQHMSTTALEAIHSRRVRPFVENPVIEFLGRNADSQDLDHLLQHVVDPFWMTDWTAERVAELESNNSTEGHIIPKPPFGHVMKRRWRWNLAPLVFGLLMRQLRIKQDKLRFAAPAPAPAKPNRWRAAGAVLRMPAKLKAVRAYLPIGLALAKEQIRVCWLHLAFAKSRGWHRVAVVGDNTAVAIIRRLARLLSIDVHVPRFPQDEQFLLAWDGPIIVGAFENSERICSRLRRSGIPREQIITIR